MVPEGPQLAFVIVGSRDEPERVGEVAFLGPGAHVLGRGDARADDPGPRLSFLRQRPGASVATGSFANSRISRFQLRFQATPGQDEIEVESVGRCPLFVNGSATTRARVRASDTLRLQNELLLICVRRPRQLGPGLASGQAESGFGEADGCGLVGESPAAWRLREDIAFAASSPEHVLVLGESGTGKELVVAAIHASSARAKRPLLARNAATLPEGLVDAELFGNLKNYPNPGMPEREGLIGQASGGTLFLDEIGELPTKLQAHLLRVLDRGGEYQRLGEAQSRRADLRIVAATNREVGALKHDFAARLKLRVAVPPLRDRREDVPLLARHLLRRIAEGNPAAAARFSAGGAAPRCSLTLMDELVRADYRTHARELEHWLWLALRESLGDELELGEAVGTAIANARPTLDKTSVAASGPRDPLDISREQLVAALAANRSSATRTARALGLKNRFAVYRAMKKHGLETSEEEPER
ncbi:MAG: sigma-54-dependent Fis family transcriptional regulator [Myxococcales bacterium]|nr:MAG: sigma-54-dependent Fis family transcriptional regulator [Myxococcales bacterium]